MAPKKISAKRSRRDAKAEGTSAAPEFDSHHFRSAMHQQRFEAIKGWSFHRERLVHPTGGSYRLLPCLGIGLVSRPCDLSRKLLRGWAHKRGGTLPLLTAAEMVKTLVYLHLSAVVGRLLANQVL